MTSKTPITPDVITIPRKVDGDILPNIIGLQKDALANALDEIGTPAKQIKMRTAQIWQWLYVKGAQSFDEMTNLSKDFRTLLLKSFSITRPEIITRQISNDGTRKYLLHKS
jgi:23S rRNA (adenine2503-C2)-methyltransferase